jgi:hypothetical protein
VLGNLRSSKVKESKTVLFLNHVGHLVEQNVAQGGVLDDNGDLDEQGFVSNLQIPKGVGGEPFFLVHGNGLRREPVRFYREETSCCLLGICIFLGLALCHVQIIKNLTID